MFGGPSGVIICADNTAAGCSSPHAAGWAVACSAAGPLSKPCFRGFVQQSAVVFVILAMSPQSCPARTPSGLLVGDAAAPIPAPGTTVS